MNNDIYAFRNPDSGSPSDSGLLAGIRMVLQPNMSVHRWPTTAGTRALEGYRALEDATVVKRLKASGALLVGTTRMSELGFGITGDTIQQAFAAGHCDAALVLDMLGEGRHSAAKAGLFGYKPSYGICSRLGLIGLIPSMESISVITSSAHLAVPIMDTVAGVDSQDFSMLWENLPDFGRASTSSIASTRIGVIKEQIDELDQEEKEAFQAALLTLNSTGLSTTELSFPDWPLFRIVHQVVGSTEASSSAGKYDSVRYGHRASGADTWNDMYIKSRAESFGRLIKAYLFQGAYFQFKNYPAFEEACRSRQVLVQQSKDLFDRVDILALPTCRARYDAAHAATIADVYNAFSLTVMANVIGAPSATLPHLVTIGDTELGLQLIGRHLDDVRLLSVALQVSELQERDY
ncbi:MAG TPA: amidase family protein [Thermodesulfobacteriota bacterium]|nr:amidase family protein [Thermodesulfobacteriota bacterium]